MNKQAEFSIIVPTMWRSGKLLDMFPVYERSKHVHEIIIIDNDTAQTPTNLGSFSKIKHVPQQQNIFVNPAWNLGAAMAARPIILANDDIIIHELDPLLQTIADSDFDIIGLDSRHQGTTPAIEKIKEWPGNNYGCFMYIRNYRYIPENLRIWYGDYIQFIYSNKKGIIRRASVEADKSTTLDSDRKYFRDTIGRADVEEWNKIERTSRINLLIRTSGRPWYFSRCVESIKRHQPDARLHIISDTEADLGYIHANITGFDYCVYSVNPAAIDMLTRNVPIERDRFIYNSYFNIIRPFLKGWCMVLDDDDELLESPFSIALQPGHVYLSRFHIGKKTVPKSINQPPRLNDISNQCLVFHSSDMVDYTPQRGGDYQFIAEMYAKCTPVWIDRVVATMQVVGHFGNRTDIKDKPISVNMATYPAREEGFLKVMENLLTFDFIDHIRVYLNEYPRVPPHFSKNKRITYTTGPDLKDNGKFYWAAEKSNEYYFTADDDLLYTREYFFNHLRALQQHDNAILVTTHGKVMKPRPVRFNDVQLSIRCLDTVPTDTWINNPGTGVMAFDHSKLNIDPALFTTTGMADLWIAHWAQVHQVPILCRAHKASELTHIENPDTLFARRGELHTNHMHIIEKTGEFRLYTPDTPRPPAFSSGRYWEERYQQRGTSGAGSYGTLAEFKAEIVNSFIIKHNIESLADFGFGDGNQAGMLKVKHYAGFEVSEKAIALCTEKFKGRKEYTFQHVNQLEGRKFDLCISMDVIFHLVEEPIFELYMHRLFNASQQWVIIYSSNGDKLPANHSAHMLDRIFTAWIEKQVPGFELVEKIENRYPYNPAQPTTTSISDFYIYKKKTT